MPIVLTGHSLTLSAVLRVARHHHPTTLSPAAHTEMARSQQWVVDLVARGQPVYGINTGFGIFANRSISSTDTQRLQRNLILSHAVGTGTPFAPEVVRAAMLIRANTLALGHSGVRPEIVETLLAMLNAGVTPVIPSQGSLGSSGDLAPLSHLALVLSTDEADDPLASGLAWFNGQSLTGQAAMAQAGIPRLVLGPKESLALNNGATFCAALAALAVADAHKLMDTSVVALALTLEALRGAGAAFDPRLHAARPHPGQQNIAAQTRALLAGSTLINAAGRVQDAYSLRCAPQVLGPALETLEFVAKMVERELNAATDNPLLFGVEGATPPVVALSGGNFHGEALGMAMDYLKIALTEVGAISERRAARLVDEHLNDGLPPMLVGSVEAAGLNSGLMMPHYTAAALTLENQGLATPDSVRSLPTSANQEDHNANATTAARHARQVVENVERILAVELLSAVQAIDLRLRQTPKARLGQGTARAHALIRTHVPFIEHDQLYGPALKALTDLIHQGAFLGLA